MAERSLRNHLLFKALPEESFLSLIGRLRQTEYRPRQVLFHEGSYPVGVFVLAEGQVKLYKTGDQGKLQIFRVCGAGEIFGFHPIFTNDIYPDTAETISNCTIGFIPREDFMEVVNTSHPVCIRLLDLLCQEFRDFIEQETYLVQKPLREKVAKCMLALKDVYFNEEAGHPILTLPRSDLADYAGTTIESLARMLHDYKEEGIIEVEGRRILLSDVPRLKKIAFGGTLKNRTE